jgi:putative endonuclease
MNYKGQNSNYIGIVAEDIALQNLQRLGLILITKNFTSRFGEIDLIMQHGKDLVFIEVKARYGGLDEALQSITYSKQKKLTKTANYYLMLLGREVNCRFDAYLIDLKTYQTKWLQNII